VRQHPTHPQQRRGETVLNLTAPSLVDPNLVVLSHPNPQKKGNLGLPQPRSETRARKRKNQVIKLQQMRPAKRSKKCLIQKMLELESTCYKIHILGANRSKAAYLFLLMCMIA
jgi:hypothetical protein